MNFSFSIKTLMCTALWQAIMKSRSRIFFSDAAAGAAPQCGSLIVQLTFENNLKQSLFIFQSTKEQKITHQTKFV
jgi:hypothetical protein